MQLSASMGGPAVDVCSAANISTPDRALAVLRRWLRLRGWRWR